MIASRIKTRYKKITDQLFGQLNVKKSKTWRERQIEFTGKDPLVCKICNAVMKKVDYYSPHSLREMKAYFDRTFSKA